MICMERHLEPGNTSASPAAELAADKSNVRLEQRRALVKALTITGPVVVAMSLSKPAWAQTVGIPGG